MIRPLKFSKESSRYTNLKIQINNNQIFKNDYLLKVLKILVLNKHLLITCKEDKINSLDANIRGIRTILIG